jgi:hypothetical protein
LRGCTPGILVLQSVFKRLCNLVAQSLPCTCRCGKHRSKAPRWKACTHSRFAHPCPHPAGDVVLDLGANVGAFARMAAPVIGPEGVVYAVEPIEGVFRALRLNNTRFKEWANAHQVAAGSVVSVHAGEACRAGTLPASISRAALVSCGGLACRGPPSACSYNCHGTTTTTASCVYARRGRPWRPLCARVHLLP